LDTSENTQRMRKRLKRDYEASMHIGCAKQSISTTKKDLSVDSFVMMSEDKADNKKEASPTKSSNDQPAGTDKRKHEVVIADGISLIFDELEVSVICLCCEWF
jgi:hypothetical protein